MALTNAPDPGLVDMAKGLDDDIVMLRRDIHREPELGLDLPRTQSKITEALTGLGLDISLGDSLTSVTADLDSGKPGPTILLRGDMDALPMQEDRVSDYKSIHDGRMHACGHDAHVSMLVGAARLLSQQKSEFTGKIRFMFQPGEEGQHGARYMIDEGVLDGVDKAYALHIISNMPSGMIFTRGGPLMASADRFEIEIKGRGGHASMPHETIDPIPCAAATITGLHTMVGRSVDASHSAVITVAHMKSGSTNNVIPETAWMEGTIRTLNEGIREKIHADIHRVAAGTAAAHGCTCTSEVVPGYPVTINHVQEAAFTGEVAQQLLGADQYVEMPTAIMGAEDFSYVLQNVPGAMAFLGACPEDIALSEAAPNHSNYMRIDENAMHRGTALYAALALAR
jgi:amidohydrolase